MYAEEFEFSDITKQLWREDDACFEAFKQQAKYMGYDIVLVKLIKRSASGWCSSAGGTSRTIPHMTIWVAGQASYERVRVESGGGSDLNAEAERDLLRLWNQTCVQFGLNLLECFDNDMAITYARAEKTLYGKVAEWHEPVAEKVSDLIGGKKPEIYHGGRRLTLHIVFTSEDFQNYGIADKIEMLESEIRRYAKARILEWTGHGDLEDVMDIRIWHPGMPDYAAMNFGPRWNY